ncbi:hypothetical protein [Lacinutrix sp. Hel_I_90]|uniref:hypothetical protein n=1 Tax=Lacinutrix sp. Hel_I_90 TaxID=1249999 RepID=UPI000AACE3DB|nr:hypothetical protein [Lacinutrix sp. Hel_I_90]
MNKIFFKIACLAILLSSFSMSASNQELAVSTNSIAKTVSVSAITSDPGIENIVPIYNNGNLVGFLIVFTNGEVFFFDLK